MKCVWTSPTNDTHCFDGCDGQNNNGNDGKNCDTSTSFECNEINTYLLDAVRNTVVATTALPSVVSLEIIPPVEGHQYGLFMQWSPALPAAYLQESLSTTLWGYKVEVSSQKTNMSVSALAACRVYIVNSTTYSNIIPLQWCYQDILAGSSLALKLTSLSENVSSQYFIGIPDVLENIFAPPSPVDWQTPVVLGTDPYTDSVSVLFQKAPDILNFTSYIINLSDINNTAGSKVRNVSQHENAFTFHNVSTDLLYKATVTPFGPGCRSKADGCLESWSAQLVLHVEGSLDILDPTGDSHVTKRQTTLDAVVPVEMPSTASSVLTSSTTSDPSIKIQPAGSRDYERSVKIIVGTVSSAVVTAVIIVVIFCLYRHKRIRQAGNFQMQRFGEGRESDSSIDIERAYEKQPLITLLYSFDCPQHEKSVIGLAQYLQNVCNCDVTLDLWAENQIKEHGVFQWTQNQIDTSQFVLIVCSTGARFKCVRNRNVRMKQDRPVADVFSWSVDYVAEKIRIARAAGESVDKYVVVYFDYAGESDIPHKMDTAKRFCLMKDFFQLYCHIQGLKPQMDEREGEINGVTAESYNRTESGKDLEKCINETKTFFQENPDWLGEILEPLTPEKNNTENKPADKSGERLSSPQEQNIHATPYLSSEEDTALEERRKRRQFEQDAVHQGLSPSHIPPSLSLSTSGNLDKSSIYTPPGIPIGRLRKRSNIPPADDIDNTDDPGQLEKDIEFINNHNILNPLWNNTDDKLQWKRLSNLSSSSSMGDMNLEGYAPPQQFVTLATLEESISASLVNTSSTTKDYNGHLFVNYLGSSGTQGIIDAHYESMHL